jgi:hypothetical protein
MKQLGAWTITAVLVTATIARAQPVPPIEPGPGSDPGSESPPDSPIATDGQPIPAPVPPPEGGSPPVEPGIPDDPYADRPTVPDLPKVKRPRINMPEVLTTPTGWLLPAAVLYSKFSLDTGGGVTSDSRVGLGDVAEFGIATTDGIRDKLAEGDRSSRIQPYVTASFRLGVAEHRLFESQPGITLGFRKSFEHSHAEFKTRIAELTLVASKHLGSRVAIHAGWAFWDASLVGDLDQDPDTEDTETTLHDLDNPRRQIRPFGGIEVRPLDRSQILVDLGWAPEFCYRCTGDHITLKPVLSWGVRYDVANWMRLESGVRVPDIGEANLLDAQIFGQVTFTSWGLRRAVDSLK